MRQAQGCLVNAYVPGFSGHLWLSARREWQVY